MTRTSQPTSPPPIVVIYGDEPCQKTEAVNRTLDRLLPADVDRTLALLEYDGSRKAADGGPDPAAVCDDLATLPLLASRRVVLVRDADAFIAAARKTLERYLEAPSPAATLVLECRSFPKNLRLAKAASAAGGQLCECRRLSPHGAARFVADQARRRHKRLDDAVAARLVELVGTDQGLLAGEVEKLALFVGQRSRITTDDLAQLVGLSRQEKIFAVMDAAATGQLPEALRLWQQLLATDPGAVYRAVGGIAFKLRQWLTAHQLVAAGQTVAAVAPRTAMWKRERELASILQRLPPLRIRRLLAELAELDSQAKLGARSIEALVEALLVQLAANGQPAR